MTPLPTLDRTNKCLQNETKFSPGFCKLKFSPIHKKSDHNRRQKITIELSPFNVITLEHTYSQTQL